MVENDDEEDKNQSENTHKHSFERSGPINKQKSVISEQEVDDEFDALLNRKGQEYKESLKEQRSVKEEEILHKRENQKEESFKKEDIIIAENIKS